MSRPDSALRADSGPALAWRRRGAQLLRAARLAAASPGVLVLADATEWVGPWCVARLAAELGDAGGRPPAAWVDRRSMRPWQPLAGLVAALAAGWQGGGEDRAAVLRRYAPVAKSFLAPGLLAADAPSFHAGVVDYVFGRSATGLRDFFRGRDVGPWVGEDLLRLLSSMAVERRPELLWLGGLDGAPQVVVETLASLPAVPWPPSSLLVLSVNGPPEALPPVLAATCERQAWPLVEIEAGDAPPLVEVVAALAPSTARALARAAIPEEPEAPEDPENLRQLAELETTGLLLRWGPGRRLVPAGYRSGGAGLPALGEQDAVVEGGVAALEAMAECWHVSDYESALIHAERAMADPDTAQRVQPELVLALLCAEAGRPRQADEHFSALLARATREMSQVMIRRLQGYAQIFGLEDFERGLETFELPRAWAEREGRTRELVFLDNTSAWAQLRLGRYDEALALETRALASVETFDPPDTYLQTLIHLNLGRLLKQSDPAAAASHVAQAMAANEGDMGPDLALIFVVLSAEAAGAQGHAEVRARWWASALELARDFDLAEVSGRLESVLRPWLAKVDEAAGRPRLPGDRTRRALELGAAEALEEGAEESADPAPEALVADLERRVEERRAVLVAERLPDPEAAVVAALAVGEPVMVLAPSRGGRGHGVAGRVLWDPRSAGAWRRVRQDLRRAETAGWVAALPRCCEDFVDRDHGAPGTLRRASLKASRRSAFAGVSPIDLRKVVVSEEAPRPEDRALARLLERHAGAGGPGWLAVTTLRLAGCSPVRDLATALDLFLGSSFEYLVVADRSVHKRLGREADANLMRLRPRVSGHCRIYLDDEAGAASGYLTAPATVAWATSEALLFVERCDGRSSLAQLLETGDASADARAEIPRFLRRLSRRGLMRFL